MPDLTVIIIDYTRFNTNIIKKQTSVMNGEILAKLGYNILTNISSLRDDVINMKNTVIKRLLKLNKNLSEI